MIGTTAAYAAAMTPTLAGSKPISLMNSFSTGTQSRNPWNDTATSSGSKRLRNEASGCGQPGFAATDVRRVMPIQCHVQRWRYTWLERCGSAE
jgi:hypothetical protein